MISYYVIGNRVEVRRTGPNEEARHIDGTLDMLDLIRTGGLFPDTADIGTTGRLMVGGCEVSELADRFGK